MRKSIILWGVAMLLVAAAVTCRAQDAANHPVKTVRIVVALAAGGGVDTSGRLLGQKFIDDGQMGQARARIRHAGKSGGAA